jgi:peptide-methionine (S)-S-oxide reductase
MRRRLTVLGALVATAALPSSAYPDSAVATFAGGCFWSTEAVFDRLPGVIEAVSGYTGGSDPSPTYEAVAGGRTGHREAVQVRYDPAKVDFMQLLVAFWHSIDPLDRRGQFCDYGSSYTTAIYVHTPEQRQLAEESKAVLEQLKFHRPLATEILPASRFHPAEAEHQDFARRAPAQYARYLAACGREPLLARIWNVAVPRGR